VREATEAARQRLLDQHDARAGELTNELLKQRTECQRVQADLEATQQKEGQALERQRRIRELADRQRSLLPADATLDTQRDRLTRLQEDKATARQRESKLGQQAEALQQELMALRLFIDSATSAGHSPAALAAKRAACARRELLLELFTTASAETLRRLREGALRQAYTEVERAWATFSGWSDAQVEPLPKGRLEVRHGGRKLDLAQLSGGERAAFLVLLHAHLGRYFGSGGFIMLDEPLEHLDADNGRRLLEHLLRACSERLLSQVVIATVEADVVRSITGQGGAHVIELPLRSAQAA
jgi:hypothetical protein